MKSAIYWGTVRHRRETPVLHHFNYKLFMVYLDLAEIDQVMDRLPFCSSKRPAPVRFKRRDYLGPVDLELDKAVKLRVLNETGHWPEGPVRMLTHLRYFGFCFNPVTFYYCYNKEDTELETVVAEITNTPWDQRRAYVLRKPASISANGTRKFTFPKDFHVSPFMPMDQRYTWFFNPPDRRLHVHMQNHEEGSKVFDATLSLERQPLSSKTMNTALLRYPLMTWRAMAAIYYQALRLRLKGAPFYSHPQSDQEFFSPKKGV